MSRFFLLVPSTYGLIGWAIAIAFIIFNPIGMTPLSGYAWTVAIYTMFVLFAFSIYYAALFSNLEGRAETGPPSPKSTLYLASTTLGVTGLIIYFNSVSSFYGGLSGLWYVITSNALDVRGNAEEFGSFAITLSYFSWISIFLGAIIVAKRSASNLGVLVVSAITVAQFLMNLVFIDRTRPVTIFIVSALGVMFFNGIRHKVTISKIALLLAVPAIFFVTFAQLTGKFDRTEGVFASMSLYIISGMGYLDSLIAVEANHGLSLVRTFMPLSKTLEFIGIINDVPEQVLEFRNIPFPTNVGTIHEPYMSDGGLMLIFIVWPALVWVLNHISYVGMKSGTTFGIFIWANCVFVLLISFFVPKFNTTSFALFMTLFLFVTFINSVASRGVKSPVGGALRK